MAEADSTELACPDELDVSGGRPAQNDGDGAAPPEMALSASERLAQDIIGNWITDRSSGECLNSGTFLHVAPGGSLNSVVLDNNKCYPENRGTFLSSGSYTLQGRTLLLEPAGSMRQFDVALKQTDTARLLRHSVFVPYDERTWRLTSAEAVFEAEFLLHRFRTTVDLVFDAPLPNVGTGDCSVTIRYAVDEYWGRDGQGRELPPAEREQSFSDELPAGSCHFQPGMFGQQLDIRAFDLNGLGFGVYNQLQSALAAGEYGPDLPDGSPGHASQLWLDPCEPDYLFVPRNSFPAIDAVPESL